MSDFVIKGKRRLVQKWRVVIKGAADLAAAKVAAIAAATTPTAGTPLYITSEELVVGTVEATHREDTTETAV